MSIKSELRKSVKLERSRIEGKDNISIAVANRLLSSKLYKDTSIILCYASLKDEINTDLIIQKALKDNKLVALPYCVDDNGKMEFYIIKSFDDLKLGSFGVREPDIDKCKKLEYFDNSIILVPALCFDKKGYRLGYGKGYYDRFLENYPFISIGLCYNSLVKNEIPIDRYDLPVDFIITEKQVISCNNGGKYGKFE